MGGALLIHVGCDVRSQKLRLQLLQGDVDQGTFGTRAERQPARAFILLLFLLFLLAGPVRLHTIENILILVLINISASPPPL